MLKLSNSLLLFPLLALGIYLGSQGYFNFKFLMSSFFSLVVLWLLLAYRGRTSRGRLFTVIIALGMLVVGHLSSVPERAWVVPSEGEFKGQVYTVRHLSSDTRVLVRLEPSRLQVAVHIPLDVKVEVGDELIFLGTIRQPRKAANPGEFCYRRHLQNLGVFGVCYPDEIEVNLEARTGQLHHLRNLLRQNVLRHVQEPGLVLALVLGERDQLGSERQEAWRRLGTSHLLAISGMHVGFLALGFGLLVQRFPFRPLVKLVAIQAALLGYVVVAGSGASAWRAFLVSILGGYATLMGVRQDSLNLWATVGWLLLLAKPTLVFDTGFTLSFAASGGILLWSPSLKVKCHRRALGFVANSLIISVIAQLSLSPLLFSYFGEMAIIGPLATLILLPCVVVLMIGGLFVAVGFGSLGLGHLLNGVMNIVGALEIMLLPYASPLKLGTLTLAEVYLLWFFFIYSGWRLRKPRLTMPRRTIAQLITLAAVILFIFASPPVLRRPLEITAVNVGQGDCYYVRTPSGLHLLIDGGGDSLYWQERGRNVGEERLVPYLKHRQVPRLDYVILSHPHEDHLFGLLAVLEHFEVGMVIDNGHTHGSLSYERYISLMEEKDIPYHVTRSGERFQLGDGVSLSVLYPDYVRPDLPSAHNNNSLLLRLQYGGMRMLFTGDLETAVLYDLVHDPRRDLSSQWLKVPHHGSSGSFLEEFYRVVDPKWAVISVGPNSFGHPHKEVIEGLDEAGINWRTTMDGSVTFQIWWGFWGRFTSRPS